MSRALGGCASAGRAFGGRASASGRLHCVIYRVQSIPHLAGQHEENSYRITVAFILLID